MEDLGSPSLTSFVTGTSYFTTDFFFFFSLFAYVKVFKQKAIGVIFKTNFRQKLNVKSKSGALLIEEGAGAGKTSPSALHSDPVDPFIGS